MSVLQCRESGGFEPRLQHLTTFVLHQNPHRGEKVAAVVGNDIGTDSRHEAQVGRAPENRKAQPHLEFGVRCGRYRTSAVAQQHEIGLTALIAMRVNLARTQQSCLMQLHYVVALNSVRRALGVHRTGNSELVAEFDLGA
jgi:hypothetical protein